MTPNSMTPNEFMKMMNVIDNIGIVITILGILNLLIIIIILLFGIGNKNIAQEILQYADGFVVGSAFVDAISAGASPNDLYKLALEIDPRTLI